MYLCVTKGGNEAYFKTTKQNEINKHHTGNYFSSLFINLNLCFRLRKYECLKNKQNESKQVLQIDIYLMKVDNICQQWE